MPLCSPRATSSSGRSPTAFTASSSREGRRGWRSMSPRRKWCAGSSAPTRRKAARFDTSPWISWSVSSPTSNPIWGTSTLHRLLQNEGYVDTVYYRHKHIEGADLRRGKRNRKRPATATAPRKEWIPIPVPSSARSSNAPNGSAATTRASAPAAPSPTPGFCSGARRPLDHLRRLFPRSAPLDTHSRGLKLTGRQNSLDTTDRPPARPLRAFDAALRQRAFPPAPPACYPVPWCLPGPDFHRLTVAG
jgi:hypothetical protein